MVEMAIVTPPRLFALAALAAVATIANAMDTRENAAPTAFVYDPVFLEHETGPGFPESPDRLRWLTAHLEDLPLSSRLTRMTPDDGIDPMPWIGKLHEAEYIEALRDACRSGEKFMDGSLDSPISRKSDAHAMLLPRSVRPDTMPCLIRPKDSAFSATRPSLRATRRKSTASSAS
jgi:acetoin utilization deacetylase AcuC-like enzyme